MITMDQPLVEFDGRKSARCEYRTFPHVKEKIARAAAMVGMDETTFVMNAAYSAAREVETSALETVISADHRDAFLRALDAPAEILPGLAALAREDAPSSDEG